MIKTLRKVWKSNWGKAALLGVGMVGYGAASRALPSYLPSYTDSLIDRTLSPTAGSTGFLADIQGQAASLLRSPFAVGEALGGKGYEYLMGKKGTTYSDFKKELQSAISPIQQVSGAVGGVKEIVAGESPRGTGLGGGQRNKITHKQSMRPIGPAGNIAIAAAGRSNAFNPNRTAHQLLAKAYQDRYYKDIDQQTGGVRRIGPNINVRDAGSLSISRPSYRYTA
tara:strand:- start:39 stop:710 length:672 start_codon:yes stop_codon:yes gene_type:complete